MTAWPNFTDPQFLDALGVGGLNAAMGVVSGSVAGLGSGAWSVPGLMSPEAMTVSFSGLVATVGLPRPWGLIASSGAFVRAHGTQTNADTTNYSVNFASLVPASGAGNITAYLAATITQIQQNPFTITGPPPGDPAYNPNFQPTTGYATNLYSVALSAVSGGIDNINTFELFRTTLTSGQVSISTYNTVGQVRASNRKAWPALILLSGGVLTQAQAQTVLVAGVSGLTQTLPSVANAGGLTYAFVNPTASWTISVSGSDTISGFGNSVAMPASGSFLLWGNAASGSWHMLGASPNMTPHGVQAYVTPGTFNFTVPSGVYFIFGRVWGGGGGGNGTLSFNYPGGPGGGGGYAEGIIAVTPGQVIPIQVGAGGTPGNNGGLSSIGSPASLVGNAGNAGGLGSGGSAGSPGSGGTGSGGDFQFVGGAGNTNTVLGLSMWISTAGWAFCGVPQFATGGGGSSTPGGAGQFPGGGGTGGTAGGGFGAGGQVILSW